MAAPRAANLRGERCDPPREDDEPGAGDVPRHVLGLAEQLHLVAFVVNDQRRHVHQRQHRPHIDLPNRSGARSSASPGLIVLRIIRANDSTT